MGEKGEGGGKWEGPGRTRKLRETDLDAEGNTGGEARQSVYEDGHWLGWGKPGGGKRVGSGCRALRGQGGGERGTQELFAVSGVHLRTEVPGDGGGRGALCPGSCPEHSGYSINDNSYFNHHH